MVGPRCVDGRSRDARCCCFHSVRAFFRWDHPGLEFGSTDPGFLVLTVHETWTLYEFIGANGELRYSFTTPKQGSHLRA